jgi:hypothetical protein
MKHVRWIVRRLGAAAISGACILSPVIAADPVVLAVADFDYVDSSGEVKDQKAEHAARLEQFAGSVRDELARSGSFRVVKLVCPKPPCSAATMEPEALIAAARDAGAQLLLFGGIHKMSTLIQQGKAQVVDLEQDKVVFDRMLSFRGDTDQAWQQASNFLVEQLEEADLTR